MGITGAPIIVPLAVVSAGPAGIAATVAAAAVLTAGGAAVLVARRTAGDQESPAGGLSRLGDALEWPGDRHVERQRLADLWQDVTDLVVQRNAQIMALRGRAERIPAQVPLPAPLRLAGVSLPHVHAWCLEADEQLTRARALLTRRTAARACHRLAERLATTEAMTISAAEELAGTTAGDPAGNPVDRTLRALDPDVGTDDYELILETAARVTTARSPLARRSSLDLLGKLVDDANDATRRHRADSLAAGRYLQAFASVAFPDAHDGLGSRVIGRLTEVIAGRRELDPELRDAAERLRRTAVRRAERLHLRELVSELMTSRGFAVHGGSEALTLTGKWPGHQVRIRVTDGQIDGELVRDDGTGATGLDRERCLRFGDDFAWLAEMLRAGGIEAHVTAWPDPAAPRPGHGPR
jgi:hypothetical protein